MRGWTSSALISAVLVACGGGTSHPPDARAPDARTPDAAPDATPPPVDAMPTTVHTYYLNFEGQALTVGADDPANNVSFLISKAFTAPPYLMNDAQRTTKIAAIVAEVQTILAPYDITITTTRPASGPYDMMVAGGLSQDAGLPQNVVSITAADCHATDQHIVLLFEAFPMTTDEAAQQIVAMLGIAQTVPQSTKAQDCLCYANPQGCGTLTGPCTIGGAGTPVYSAQACNPQQTVMDENAEWLQVFGAHP